jgi:hypothetical protein
MPQVDELKRAFAIQTAQEAVKSIIEELPAGVLAELVDSERATEEGAMKFIINLVTAAEPRAATEASALDRARARGLRVRQDLLEQEGGLVSAAELADLLGISRQAVDDRRKQGELVALKDAARHFKYPVWQSHEGNTLPGLEDVLMALDMTDPMTAIVFYLQPDPRIGGKRPLDAAREGQSGLVLRLAMVFGEHGAL